MSLSELPHAIPNSAPTQGLSFDRYRTALKGTWKDGAGPASGQTYDLGSHLIDQALALFGRPKSITALIENTRNIGDPDVDDSVGLPDLQIQCGSHVPLSSSRSSSGILQELYLRILLWQFCAHTSSLFVLSSCGLKFAAPGEPLSNTASILKRINSGTSRRRTISWLLILAPNQRKYGEHWKIQEWMGPWISRRKCCSPLNGISAKESLRAGGPQLTGVDTSTYFATSRPSSGKVQNRI